MSAGLSTAHRRDAWVLTAGLVMLLAWEMSGADLATTRWVAAAQGFAWRDHWLTSGLLHGGGRLLGWVLLAGMVFDLVHPLVPFTAGPTRGQRLQGLAMVLAGLVLVPSLKRFSSTSCPWDLAEFGGLAAYVPHWLPGVADGGPGHCFPSGHAVAAFAFFGVYFVWREHRPAAARWMLAGVLMLGLAFGWAQWLRGAHFVSHTLWSAWLCWTLGAAVSRLRGRALPAGRSPTAQPT